MAARRLHQEDKSDEIAKRLKQKDERHRQNMQINQARLKMKHDAKEKKYKQIAGELVSVPLQTESRCSLGSRNGTGPPASSQSASKSKHPSRAPERLSVKSTR